MAYGGFPKVMIDSLTCPHDGAAVCLSKESRLNDGLVWAGSLGCRKCSRIYSIDDGIVLFLDKGPEVEDLLKAEIEMRDQEAERYEEKFKARYFKEVVSVTKAVGSTTGETIIEYASGTGRFTEIFSVDAKSYLAVDFSLRSLQITARKIKTNNVGLVLADATRFSTKENHFEKAFAFQFIEHIPSRHLRDVFYGNVRKTLKPGGRFVSVTYHNDLRRIMNKVEKEGFHSGGIFYHYFDLAELKKEIADFFGVMTARPFDITLPFEARCRLSPKVGGVISRMVEKIPLVRRLGHLILVVAVKK